MFAHKIKIKKLSGAIMAITHDVKRTEFFAELPQEKQESYLGLTREKSLCTIDNLYYSVYVTGDGKENVPVGLEKLLEDLELSKAEVIRLRMPVDFEHDLECVRKSYKFYSYCTGNSDLYDIFFCETLPNDDTPRIVVQIRAHGLWTRGMDEMLEESYNKVRSILADYSCTIARCMENRIDYCYHTNSISSVNRVFKEDSRGKVKNLHTNLKSAKWHSDIKHEEDGTLFVKDYLCLGGGKSTSKRPSNNVRARAYNKVKEVVEMGYKSFFFKIWHDNGLISYYDKWCMEYAYSHQNIDYLAKGAIEFYVNHGTDPDRVQKYKEALSNPNTSLAQFKELAAEYMPKVTTIMNFEYETKRKFYYLSDRVIDSYELSEKRATIAKPLARIYKILDYRDHFLKSLTRNTLSFYNGFDEKGEPKYLAWWNRLRNTKHDGMNVDGELLREYSLNMDKQKVQRRIVNALASCAVYDEKVGSGFVEDVSDLLSNISDNQIHTLRAVDEDGVIVEEIDSWLTKDYQTLKVKKERLARNRIRARKKTQLAKGDRCGVCKFYVDGVCNGGAKDGINVDEADVCGSFRIGSKTDEPEFVKCDEPKSLLSKASSSEPLIGKCEICEETKEQGEFVLFNCNVSARAYLCRSCAVQGKGGITDEEYARWRKKTQNKP